MITPPARFKGKVAIATGSGRGIGRATAIRLASEGASCCVTARTTEDIESVKREIEAMGGQAIAVRCDVGDTEQVRHMVEETVKAFGRIDYLVNNAAGSRQPGTPQGILDCTEEDWNATINTALTSVYRVSRAALPYMIKAGGGAIVNVSSTRGLSGRKNRVAYCSAKAAVINLTRCMALDLLDYNIRVNCVCPGHVLNEHMKATADLLRHPERADEILSSFSPEVQAKIRSRVEALVARPEDLPSVLGRGFDGYPEDLANVIVFLLSDEARFVNGEVIVVDGGSSAGK